MMATLEKAVALSYSLDKWYLRAKTRSIVHGLDDVRHIARWQYCIVQQTSPFLFFMGKGYLPVYIERLIENTSKKMDIYLFKAAFY